MPHRNNPPGAGASGNPARVIKQVAELTCPPGWFERPYTWPPYAEPEPFDPGAADETAVSARKAPRRGVDRQLGLGGS